MKKLYLRLAAVFAAFLLLMAALYAGSLSLRALQENRHYLDQLLTGLEDNLVRAYEEEEEKRILLEEDYLNRAWAVEYILWNAAVTQDQLETVRQLMEVEGIALLDREGTVLQSAGRMTGPREEGPAFDGQGEQVIIDPGDFYTAPAYLYAQVLSGQPGRARVRLDAQSSRLGLLSGSQLVAQTLLDSTTEGDTLLGAVDGSTGLLLGLSANNAQTVAVQGADTPLQRLEVLKETAETGKLAVLRVNGEYHTVLVRKGEGVYLLAMTRLSGVLSGMAAALIQGLAGVAAVSLLAMGAVHLFLKRYFFSRIAQMEDILQGLLAGEQPPDPVQVGESLPELRPLARTLEQLRQDYIEKSQGICQMECQLSQARSQASFDQLTGLYNRSGFEERARRFLEQEGGQGILLLFDLDNFKRVNDREGHPVGDRVLVQFAHCLRDNLRKSDVVGRLGGDEFVALLPNPMAQPLLEEKLESLLESARRTLEPFREKHQLSVSVGAVSADGRVKSYQELYRCADTALYIAKYLGKDGYYINDKMISCMRRVCVGCRRDCPRSQILRQLESPEGEEQEP